MCSPRDITCTRMCASRDGSGWFWSISVVRTCRAMRQSRPGNEPVFCAPIDEARNRKILVSVRIGKRRRHRLAETPDGNKKRERRVWKKLVKKNIKQSYILRLSFRRSRRDARKQLTVRGRARVIIYAERLDPFVVYTKKKKKNGRSHDFELDSILKNVRV